MRLTVCLEGNSEGRVLASVDMEEIVKMTITDDIEKSNFNPQMLKSCTDTSYQCGYEQGRADAIDEIWKGVVEEYDNEYCPCVDDYMDYQVTLREIDKILERMKESKE